MGHSSRASAITTFPLSNIFDVATLVSRLRAQQFYPICTSSPGLLSLISLMCVRRGEQSLGTSAGHHVAKGPETYQVRVAA